jgi:hypothetical protein
MLILKGEKMYRTYLLMAVICCIMAAITGCEGVQQSRTGFLSDYSKLKAVSDESYRYVDEQAVDDYSAFIVDEVKIHFFSGSAAIRTKSEGKITEQDLDDLTNYFHSAIIKAITDSGREVVYRPGPGVARIRVALTDLKETGTLNVLPQASILGVDVGGAAMEAEVVDSVTGKQIGAVVESRKGSRVPFSNLGDWATAKGVMDHWANRLRERLQ